MSPETWRRVEVLFEEALQHSPDTWEVWLQEQCQGDEELHHEVRRLVAADAKAKPAVSGAIAESVRALNAEPGRSAIGPYQILSEIGRGGMGVVYLARRNDDVFNKQVAIKVVKRGMDTEQVLSRFLHERRILARLEHPYIARILDGGSTADGLPYLVMEYIQGVPITDYCREHHLNLEARIELFRKVCAAVAYAHQSLVVHRDLKPSNILVDEAGTPRLLDFGIAKLLDAETGDGLTTLTSEAMRLLTPRYASPEQVSGEPITTASDIYSLGAVLYELLTSAPAHRITTATPAALVKAVCEEDVVPASVAARSPDSPVPSVKLAGDLDNILLTALRKERQQRYASVEKFSEDLQHYLEHRPVNARPRTARYRMTKFVRRNAAAVIATSVAAALLIAGTLVSTYQARRADRRFQQLRKLANTFLFDIHDQLEGVAGTTPAREIMVRTAVEYLDAIAREATRDSGLQWELATAYQRVGDLQGYALRPNLGRPEAGLESHRKALAIAQQLSARDPSERNQLLLANAFQRNGYILRQLGDTRGAVEYLQKGLTVAEPLEAQHPGDAAECQVLIRLHRDLGDIARGAGNTPEASSRDFRILETAQRWNARHPDEVSRSFVAMGHMRTSQGTQDTGDLTNALQHAREQVAIYEELSATHQPNQLYQRSLANGYSRLGDVLADPRRLSLEDSRQALAYFEKELAIFGAMASGDRTNVLAVSDYVGALMDECTALAQEGAPRATEICRQGLDVLSRSPGAPPVYRGLLLAGAGAAQVNTGHPKEAQGILRQAIEYQRTLSADRPTEVMLRQDLMRTLRLMAESLRQTGDRPHALEYYREALSIAEDLSRANPHELLPQRDVADSYESLGRFYETADRAQAREWYRKSLDIWAAWPRSAPSTSLDQSRRARVAEELARCEKR